MMEGKKMLTGQLYGCGDVELLTQWHGTKDLVRDYNSTDSADTLRKNQILNGLLGGRGEALWITAPSFADCGDNICFGNNCEVNMNCTFSGDNVIRIENNALIVPSVQVYTAFRPINIMDRFGVPQQDGSFAFYRIQAAPVMIGDNVWISGGVTTMPGVTIGDNVVIGAGSVAAKDVPGDTITYGNPCRVRRENR